MDVNCTQSTALCTSTIAGFPASWKIMENLENEKSIFQTWKNHGILKKKPNHGKIMEFENTSMEKSWKFFLSCTRIIQKKFALRVQNPMLIMKLLLFVSYFVEKNTSMEKSWKIFLSCTRIIQFL